jgi:tetratricopeptide (TPR) repeat protein
MSPSSRGVVPGLFLALAAAVAILQVNDSWLLPAVDDTGVAYLEVAPRIAVGVDPVVPWSAWDAARPTSTIEGRGTAFPLLMSALMHLRPRAHVAGLWAMAASAAVLFLAVGWVVGGVSGMPGALIAGVVLAVSAPLVGLGTALRPELLAMALVALQLGLMTYRPRGSLAIGVMAALAWLAHPVAVGAVAAAVVWPLAGPERPVRRAMVDMLSAAVPAVALLATGRLLHGLLVPAPLHFGSGNPLGGAGEALGGLFGAAAGGIGGSAGVVIGAVLSLGAAAWVLREAGETPRPEADIHWSDPAAPDLLATLFRPAAGLLLLALLVSAAFGGGGARGELAAPWALAWLPGVTLVSASVVRGLRRNGGGLGRLVAGVLAVWIVASGWVGAGRLASARADGAAYSARVWVDSEVIRWVDNQSDAYPVVYASSPPLLAVQSRRATRALPVDPARIDDFVRNFRMHPGAIVLTDSLPAALDAAPYESALGLRAAVETDEGTVLTPAPLPEGVEAISFLGDTLRAPELPPAVRAVYQARYEEAEDALARAPEDADALIWMGRRTAYLGQYREAIDIYSHALTLHPDDARLYRHRGHRYLTVRQPDRAIADFRRAAGLTAGKPDEVEPDGLPNARGIPTSTLQYNIWYHLGLAYYLEGALEAAAGAYRNCLELSENDDSVVAASYWLYMTLRRLGRDAEASDVLEAIHADMDVIEGDAYLDLLLLFRGERAIEDFVGAEGSDATLNGTTTAYGVGVWYLLHGRPDEGYDIFRRIRSGESQWAAFGFLAAEAELARAPSGG